MDLKLFLQRLEKTEFKVGRKERKLKICKMISEFYNPLFYVVFSLAFTAYCLTIQ